MTNAELIWYTALNQGGLTANAQFLDATNALITSCEALGGGSNGVCDDLKSSLQTVGLSTTVGGGGTCPLNSSPAGDECICDPGYQPSTDGLSCEAIPDLGCPANSTQSGEYCYCDEGYVPDATGNACVLERDAPCPSNSHRVGELCYCDDGYYGDPNIPQGACVAEQGGCVPFSYYDGADCYCIDGFEPDAASGTECVPVAAGSCGAETFLGRCAYGLLVYCDDQTDPALPEIIVTDCTQDGRVCGYDGTNGFFNCVDYDDPCGTIDENGVCSGNQLTYCAGTGVERQLFDIDCAAAGQQCIVDAGFADCADPNNNNNNNNPTLVDDCRCDTTTACDKGCSCDVDCDGGCAATQPQWPGLLLLMVCLGWLRFRRRSERQLARTVA